MPNSNRTLCALAAGLLSAVAARAEVLQDTVATVNGKPLMLTEYKKNLESVLDNVRRTSPNALSEKDTVAEIKRKVLDQMVDDQLLYEEAARRQMKIHEREVDNGISEVKERNFRTTSDGHRLSDDEIEKALNGELKREGLNESDFRDRIRRQLMILRVQREIVSSKVKPPEEADVKKAFEKIKSVVKGDTTAVQGMEDMDAKAMTTFGQRIKDMTAERIRASHIFFKLPAKASMIEKTQIQKRAQDVKKQIDDGADFAELAKKISEDKESAEQGGELGFVLRGWMPAEFEKVAFALPVGDLSDPVETPLGYHIIRVQSHQAAESVTFDKLKDDVGQFLVNLASQKEIDKFLKGLKASAHIEIKLPKDN